MRKESRYQATHVAVSVSRTLVVISLFVIMFYEMYHAQSTVSFNFYRVFYAVVSGLVAFGFLSAVLAILDSADAYQEQVPRTPLEQLRKPNLIKKTVADPSKDTELVVWAGASKNGGGNSDA